jgi:hypothetical protein
MTACMHSCIYVRHCQQLYCVCSCLLSFCDEVYSRIDTISLCAYYLSYYILHDLQSLESEVKTVLGNSVLSFDARK